MVSFPVVIMSLRRCVGKQKSARRAKGKKTCFLRCLQWLSRPLGKADPRSSYPSGVSNRTASVLHSIRSLFHQGFDVQHIDMMGAINSQLLAQKTLVPVGSLMIPHASANAPRCRFSVTSLKYPARCSTASTFTSTCLRSSSRTSLAKRQESRRPAYESEWWPRGVCSWSDSPERKYSATRR